MSEMDPNLLDDMEMEDDDEMQASLFWSLKIPAQGTAEITEPAIPDYIIHVTKACFGPKVTNGSRSVVMCGVDADDDGKPMLSTPNCLVFSIFVVFIFIYLYNVFLFVFFFFDRYNPICCLKANTMENVNLDLVYGGM